MLTNRDTPANTTVQKGSPKTAPLRSDPNDNQRHLSELPDIDLDSPDHTPEHAASQEMTGLFLDAARTEPDVDNSVEEWDPVKVHNCKKAPKKPQQPRLITELVTLTSAPSKSATLTTCSIPASSKDKKKKAVKKSCFRSESPCAVMSPHAQEPSLSSSGATSDSATSVTPPQSSDFCRAKTSWHHEGGQAGFGLLPAVMSLVSPGLAPQTCESPWRCHQSFLS